MRAFAFGFAASLAVAAPAEAASRRVASLNLCTDELLLMLAEPGQVVSVSHLAQRPAETALWRQARRHRRNDGSLVSVVGLKPDLVLTMGGGARDRLRIAKRLGIPTLDLPFPQSLADIEKGVRRVGAALGRAAAAEAVIARVDALKRSAPPARTDTIWLSGGGQSIAADSLGAQWMALAGLRQRPLRGDIASLEELLVRPPGFILRSDYRSGQYSGRQRWLSHPLAKGPRRSRTLATDGRPWTCLGPLLIPEIERLRKLAS